MKTHGKKHAAFWGDKKGKQFNLVQLRAVFLVNFWKATYFLINVFMSVEK